MLGLEDLFTAPTEPSGLVIENYSFDRYVDAYTGLMKMVRAVSHKLKFTTDRNRVILSVEPIVDYSKDEQFDSDTVEMQIEKTEVTVNHLICLGKGELTDRTVIHLYTDAEGNISQTQTFFRSQEVVATYDYPNAESAEELVKNGIEKLKEYAEKGLAEPEKFHVFFKAKSLRHDFLCMVSADITVVPGFKNDAGDIFLILLIADDKAIIPAIFCQPLTLLGFSKSLSKLLTDTRFIDHIDTKARLVIRRPVW